MLMEFDFLSGRCGITQVASSMKVAKSSRKSHSGTLKKGLP